MLTLYGKARSRAARCLWLLEELALPYRHIATDPLAGDTKTAEFLALAPAGKIPVLVDGEFVLSESIAINEYLATLAPGPLVPDDPLDRARVRQWSCWAVAEAEPPLTVLVRAARSGAAADGSGAAATEQAHAALTVLERHVQSREFLVGKAFTLADINAAIGVRAAPMVMDMAAFAAIPAWLARVFARPAWQRVEVLP